MSRVYRVTRCECGSWGRDVEEAGDGNCVMKRWKRQRIVVAVGEGGECAPGTGKQLLSVLEMC